MMIRFYFSRTSDVWRVSGVPLVSGVIEGDTLNVAKARLNALMAKQGLAERSHDFSWVDLSSVPVPDHGVVVITTLKAA